MNATLKKILVGNFFALIFCFGMIGSASAFTLHASSPVVRAGASVSIGVSLPLPSLHIIAPAPVQHVHVVRERAHRPEPRKRHDRYSPRKQHYQHGRR